VGPGRIFGNAKEVGGADLKGGANPVSTGTGSTRDDLRDVAWREDVRSDDHEMAV